MCAVRRQSPDGIQVVATRTLSSCAGASAGDVRVIMSRGIGCPSGEDNRTDLETERNDLVQRKASDVRMLPACIVAQSLELAERMLSVRSDVTSNPSHAANLIAGAFDDRPERVELVGRHWRKRTSHDESRHFDHLRAEGVSVHNAVFSGDCQICGEVT